MTVATLAYSLLGVALTAGLLSVVASRTADATPTGPLSSYLLASGSLGKASVVSLLVSSSFGLNSLLYAAWLGYAIGVYALVVQASWSLSFFLLARYAAEIRRHKSMHHFLGHDFGPPTRVVAGLCSVAGMMYFIGWEAEIARQTFADLIAKGHTVSTATMRSGDIIASGTIVACLLYTVLGGLRGNALADKALNLAKVLCAVLALGVLGFLALRTPLYSFKSALLPSRAELIAGLGIFGFVTNVIFNLSWQFVDASTWQSIIAGRQVAATDARDNVRASGIAIFFIPNVLATLLGVFLHGAATGITGDNIISRATLLATTLSPLMAIVASVMIVACVMSLLDGMFLACAFTLIVDIVFPTRTLDDLDEEPIRAEAILVAIRVALVAIAAVAAWGVHYLVGRLQLTVFQFVYVVVITQLGLLGPILIGLIRRRRARVPMWIPIVLSVLVGLFLAWKGTHGWNPRWADAAGTITAGLSVVTALLLSARHVASDATEALS